ncbi:unnamed protein product, partial [Meganyctiphanes norvegica]
LHNTINIWAPSNLEERLYGLCRLQGGTSLGHYGSSHRSERHQKNDKITKKRVEKFALSWRTLLQENDICTGNNPSFEDPNLCAGKNEETLEKFRNKCRVSIEQAAPHIDVETKNGEI